MKLVLAEVDVQYVGADIVKPLIQSLSQTYGDAKTSFAHLDLIEDALPRADLMVCRDCLFHLSYAHTHAVLENFARANIRYLLTSTHVNAPRRFDNLDIETGDFRYIDLFDRPYHFAREPLQAIDDWMPPEPPRQLCLWRRDQVIDALARFTPPSDEDGWG